MSRRDVTLGLMWGFAAGMGLDLLLTRLERAAGYIAAPPSRRSSSHVTTLALGRHPDAAQHHDPQSRNFAATPAPVIPDRVYWKRFGVSLNQLQVGACTCFATDGALNHAPNHQTGDHRWTDTESFELYDYVTHHDPYPGAWTYSGSGDVGSGEDTGSDGLSAAKGALAFGRIKSYTHAFGVDHLAQALPNGPLIMGSDWYDGMFNPDSKGVVSISGSLAGGHEYVVDGLCYPCRMFRFNNSWSNGWGKNGRFWMTWDTTDQLLGAGGDAIQFTVR